ncbi:Protein CELLULOSE SYNTHASE INTERACTIVE 1 [Bienertia sinuspersici]
MAASTATAATTAALEREKTLQDELALPILLTDRVIKSAGEAESSRSECADIARQADELSQKLRAAVRLTSSPSTSSIYDRPIRRIAADVSKNLEKALTLVRKCKHTGLLRHVFLTITSSAADFKRVSNLLQSSIGDFVWLLSIYNDDEGGANLSIPPIVNNDPIIAWVWSSIASLQTNRQLKDRIESANYLASLASDNERFRKVIVEEGAVSPLLRLLKDGGGSPDGQIAAATALFWLVDDRERTRIVAAEGGIPIMVQVFGESCMSVQVAVAELVAKVAQYNPATREEFGRENVLKPLISCLILDMDMEDYKQFHGVQKELAAKNHPKYNNYVLNHGHSMSNNTSYHKVYSSASFDVRGGSNYNKRERENESPEIKLKLKIKSALALWRLCKGSMLNSQKVAEPKGLFCLAKIIETERGELQYNCLMTIMEVAEVAEDNAELRKAAWKPSSPPAKAVLDQLLRVIKEESNPDFQVPAIKAIGCLARIFPAKETGIVGSLVGQLGNKDFGAATEAAVALAKFACPDNHNCVAHSKTIIEFNGVPPLMKLLSINDRARRNGLVLLCYLSMHVGNSKELAEARALRTLESAVRSGMAQNAELRDIFSRAVHHLMLYQDGSHPHSHTFAVV